MSTRSLALAAVIAITVTAGCASKVTAPVRDGSGAPASPATRAPAQPAGTHLVRQGDTLLGIARQYGVTLPDLVVWNGITSPNQIRPGQTLRVAPPAADSTTGVVVTPIGGPAVSSPLPQPGAADTAAVAPRQEPPLTPPPQITPPPPAPETAAARSKRWQWPARGPVVAGFNDNTNKGVDIGGRVGDPVLAAAAGKVVYAGSGLRGYGKLIVIKHDQEYNSVYAHNDKLLVKEDDQVAQGQQIAELGSTESDKPKLHFEIRKQGKAVDPASYLPAR